MERLQRSMNQYVKWMGRHLEPSEDKEKALPVGYLGRTMVGHGEEFHPESEFGNCLVTMGRANERVSAIQETFVGEATTSWLESLERSLTVMREYQVSYFPQPSPLKQPANRRLQTARKKLETRRLNYDTSMGRVHKAKRDDFRLEEELRGAKAKYEESSEDVLRRMQDIQDMEAEATRDLTHFLDAELEYHERAAEELRRVRQNWPSNVSPSYSPVERRPTQRSRASTTQSYNDRLSRTTTFEAESSTAPPVRMPVRPANSRMHSFTQQADGPVVRPTIGKSSYTTSASFQGGATLTRERGASVSSTPTAAAHNMGTNVGALRGQLRPVSRIVTAPIPTGAVRDSNNNDVFADRDDDSGASDTGSPSWGNRSTSSSTTSVGSLSRTPSNNAVMGSGNGNFNGLGGLKKAPPPPPPSRAKKPPPPVPARREVAY